MVAITTVGDVTALSPQQVNSYPAPTQRNITVAGERIGPSAVPDTPDLRKQNFLQKARDRFKVCVDAESRRRSEMLTDHQFYGGEQWDTGIKLQRQSQRRPCLTINRMPGFVNHVVNNMRQERPGIRIVPVGDGSDEEQAQIRQGIIRHIETDSKADIAYDTAFQDMCIGGLGWLRVVDDWEDPKSFNKELVIRAVRNPFTVYSDPFVSQPDWSDMKFAFITEDLTREQFIEQYGKEKQVVSNQTFMSLGDQAKYWFPGGNIRVCEYYYIEQEKDILCELETGNTILWSEIKTLRGLDGEKLYSLEFDSEGDRVIHLDNYYGRTRDCVVPVVKWAKISAVDILKERVWGGSHIPLIPVLGNQIQMNGENVIVGMVRYARGPQETFNYTWSSVVEAVALAPKAPFVIEEDQLPDGNDGLAWQNANTSPVAVLKYKKVVAEFGNSGALLPAPQRQQAEPPIQALVQTLQLADAHLKAVFSIYEASLGQRGPQESGKAINARKVESETATYNWGDNFVRALKHLGTIINDLLPMYYNEPGRVVQINREDESRKRVVMNQEFTERGQVKKFDLSNGRYATQVKTGPSDTTRREQGSMAMLELAKVYPPLMQMAGDLVVGEMDWPGKDAIADRLKKTLPPGLAEQSEDEQEFPPEAQEVITKMTEQINVLSEQLGKATDETNLERMKQEYDTLRTQMVEENKLAMAELKAGTQEAQFLSQKIFEELQAMRAALLPQTVGTPSQ